MNEAQQRILDSVAARLSEHFTDYLIMARPDTKGIMWRSSNPTWAYGAAARYTHAVSTNDALEQSEHYQRGSE